MIFNVSVAYHANGRVNGARVNSRVGFAEVRECNVFELTETQAPIVASWTDATPALVTHEPVNPNDMTYIRPAPYRGEEHVRCVDGQFLRPMRLYELVGEGRPEDMAMVDVVALQHALSKSLVAPLADWQNANTKKTRTPADHFQSIESTNRQFAHRYVDDFMSKLAVVDGMVYVKCERPVIAVVDTRFTAPQGHAVFREAGREGYILNYWSKHLVRILTVDTDPRFHKHANLFPIHAFNEALKTANRLNSSGVFDREAIAKFNPEQAPVLSDEYPHDRHEEECLVNLRFFIAGVEKGRDRLLPVGGHEQLRLFSDLVRAYYMLPDSSGYDLLETAGREYIQRFGSPHRHIHPEQIRLEKAIELSENRPVEVQSFGMVAQRPF